MGFWTGGVHTKAAIKAVATNNGKSHEQFYREEDERRVMAVPFEDENARDVNKTLSKVLMSLHIDHDLMNFLAKQ